MYEFGLGIEKTCPVCGKTFVVQDVVNYVYQKEYKHTHMWYCSWTCFRKAVREHGSRKVMPIEYRENYFTTREAARVLGVKPETIKRAVAKDQIPTIIIEWEGKPKHLIRKEDVYARML